MAAPSKLYRSLCQALPGMASCVCPQRQTLSRSILDCWQAKKIVTGEICGRVQEKVHELGETIAFHSSFVCGSPGIGTEFAKRVLAPTIWFMKVYVEGIGTPLPSLGHATMRVILVKEWETSVARPLLAQILLNGIILDLQMFTILIDYYCQNLNYQHLISMAFFEMKALGIKPDDNFCKDLIDGMCTHIGPNLSYELLKKLRRDQVKIPLLCYNRIVHEFCKRKMMNDANVVLTDMKQYMVFPDNYIYTCLFKEYCRDMGGEGLFKVVNLRRQMSEQGLELNADMVGILIDGFCRIGLIKAALHLFYGYRRMGFVLHKDAYCHAMHCYSKLGVMDEAISLLKEMKKLFDE